MTKRDASPNNGRTSFIRYGERGAGRFAKQRMHKFYTLRGTGGDNSKITSAILNGKNLWGISVGGGDGLYGAGSFSINSIDYNLGGGYIISFGGQFGVGTGGTFSFGYTPTWSTDAERIHF
ncbi:MAG: hypothetical protein PHH37_01465 [Paludibacter sp.]|nr:hypothetical protein [Paludibacter sp.]